MSYEQFETLLRHQSPRFVCKAAGRGRKSERFTANLTHEVRSPASPSDLAKLNQLVPDGAKELLAFYARHDGFVLYRDTLSDTAGVELYRVADMETNTKSMREWLEMLDDENDTNALKTAIAIGESPQSGNYFAMPVKGRQIGKVFFVDHDDWRDEPFADSFDQFLAEVSTSPAELLSDRLGCTARYSDGDTDTQWIPLEYLSGIPSG
jgi:hypothetical protein